MGIFYDLKDNLLSIDMIILHKKVMKNHDLALNQKQFKEYKCLKIERELLNISPFPLMRKIDVGLA